MKKDYSDNLEYIKSINDKNTIKINIYEKKEYSAIVIQSFIRGLLVKINNLKPPNTINFDRTVNTKG